MLYRFSAMNCVTGIRGTQSRADSPHRRMAVRSSPKRPGSEPLSGAGGRADGGGYEEWYKAQPTKRAGADFGELIHAPVARGATGGSGVGGQAFDCRRRTESPK